MAERARLDVEALDYRVGGHQILTAVSLRVAPGEFVGLVGPNGAGKTTLLRAISGLLAPSRGRVYLEGQSLDRLDPTRIARLVAHVPQSAAIDFRFTCLEVVLMGRHPHLGRFALEGPEDERLAREAMTTTETHDLAERPITAISGGQRQRVLTARALAQQPRLLLLDEPTANLDILHQLRLLDLVRRLVRVDGLSAIAAIHDLELAARYCDRLVLLKDGRVLAEGPPAAVLTPEQIKAAFGVNAIVRPDPLTGGLSVAVLSPGARAGGSGEEVRVAHRGGRSPEHGRDAAVAAVAVEPEISMGEESTMRHETSRRRGLVIVYTGNGKGKTTAAVGLAVRAAGHRLRVFFLQFIKGRWKSGEREILRSLAPYVELAVTGRGFTLEHLRDPRLPVEAHHEAAAAGWQLARQLVSDGAYDMIVLDEILGAITAGLVPLEEVLEVARAKPPELHLVLTGRGAPPPLIEVADLVSEVVPVKHPYQQGVKAQRGIEF